MSTPLQPQMPEQPETREENFAGSPKPELPALKPRIPRWMHRLELFLRVMVRIYVGVLVVLLPWTRLWDSNPFFAHHPAAAVYLLHGSVRGVVSGLGLLNLWIALQDAVHYRDM
jgi:hypothetical protein